MKINKGMRNGGRMEIDWQADRNFKGLSARHLA